MKCGWYRYRSALPRRSNEKLELLPDPDDQVPHGTIHIESIFSKALGQSVKCYVYTPPGYASSGKKYPVLYLLHGGSGDPSNWTSSGSADVMADNFIGQKKM